jgi:pyruvate dehydrogenase E1 component alpha subunit
LTYRWQGHFSGDPAAYRPAGELEKWKEKDPIKLAKSKLISEYGVPEADIQAIHDEIEIEIKEYVKFSLESPAPDPENALQHVYSDITLEAK